MKPHGCIFPASGTRWASFAFSVLCFAVARSETCHGEEEGWKVFKGTHFLVHYRQEAAEAENVGKKAEEDYDRIKADLGFTKQEDFWLWDRRVKIFIYDTREEFIRATDAPKWAAGKARASKGEIATFRGSPGFLDTVLPHELAHLVFKDFIGFKGEAPLWLNEGVAQWEEKAGREKAGQTARNLLADNHLLSVAELARLDVRRLTDPEKAAEFYAQSASLAGFIIQKHGSESFRKFCGQLRDGKTLDDALRFTYPETIRSLDALERAWKQQLKQQLKQTQEGVK